MKVAIQAPIPLLEIFCTLSNYHVCLPTLLLEDTRYYNFYYSRKIIGDYLIIDSSELEPRKPVASEVLFKAVEVLKPDLVVAPDRDMNAVKTVELTVEFLDKYGKKIRKLGTKILGMVQGATITQCLFSYRNIYKLVDAIGLPRSTEVAVGRHTLVKKLRTTKPIHIFGIHSNPELELDKLLDLDRKNIIGVSSSLPVRLGFLCRLLDEFRPEPPRLDYYSDYNPFPDFTRKNIEDFIDLAGG